MYARRSRPTGFRAIESGKTFQCRVQLRARQAHSTAGPLETPAPSASIWHEVAPINPRVVAPVRRA